MSNQRFWVPSSGPNDGNRYNQTAPPATSPPMPSVASLKIDSSSSPPIPQGAVKLTARSCLYELCAASRWKSPSLECFKEEGPSHQRWFTYKCTVEIENNSSTVVECLGKPQLNKKSAADSAAEGVLWYLNYLGYPKKNLRSKKSR